MSLRIMPDAEAMTIGFLNGQADVLTLLGGAERVYSAVPNTPTYPLVVVRRAFSGPPRVREHLDVVSLQIDCYADTKSAARLLAATVLAALYTMPAAGVPGGVITSVDETRGLTWLPDDVVPTPRPRYTFDVEVTVHP